MYLESSTISVPRVHNVKDIQTVYIDVELQCVPGDTNNKCTQGT